MRDGMGPQARRLLHLVILSACLLLMVPPTQARSPESPTVRGSVTGVLTAGGRSTLRITATHPEGWQALDEVSLELQLHGAALEELTYEVYESILAIGADRVLVGTGDTTEGRFFQVRALEVSVTTEGNRLVLAIQAGVLKDFPPQSRFRFTAVDDAGEETTTSVAASVAQEEKGLSLGTVAVVVGAALLAGGFLGTRFTSHRRPTRSVWAAVEQRVMEERGSRPANPPER